MVKASHSERLSERIHECFYLPWPGLPVIAEDDGTRTAALPQRVCDIVVVGKEPIKETLGVVLRDDLKVPLAQSIGWSWLYPNSQER